MDDQTPDAGAGGHVPGGTPATGGPGRAAAGVPGGAAPSGATSPGAVADDEQQAERPAVPSDATSSAEVTRAVPGQPPGPAVPPVPVPGNLPGAEHPTALVGEAPSPEDELPAGEKSEGSDAGVVSPGSYVALAPPGYPDGTNDTRAR